MITIVQYQLDGYWEADFSSLSVSSAVQHLIQAGRARFQHHSRPSRYSCRD